jgi:PHD-finger
MEYDFVLQHIPGSTNLVADCLSRLLRNPDAPEEPFMTKLTRLPPWPLPPTALAVAECHVAKEVSPDLPCMLCTRIDGPRSMVICESCARGAHLQCLPGPERASGPPPGPWVSAECRPLIRVPVGDAASWVYDPATPLPLHPQDPRLDRPLMALLHLRRRQGTGTAKERTFLSTLAPPAQQAVRKRAVSLHIHEGSPRDTKAPRWLVRTEESGRENANVLLAPLPGAASKPT